MVVELTIVVLDDLDLVAAMALIGTSMKVAGIFISFKCRSNLTPLFPKFKLSLGDPAEDAEDQSSQVMFRQRTDTRLLHIIHQVDHDPTVSLLLGEIGFIPCPCP